MANDPRDLDGHRLREALHKLGRNVELRNELMALLKRAENYLMYDGSVRDEVTGPIADALHDDDDTYEKVLTDGTKFRFLFRTKIARDFLMSDMTCPNHVWEPQTTKLLLTLTSGMHRDVIIGGAYFGDHAVLVARKVQQYGSRVHCFEPNAEQARMLSENASINHVTNLIINRIGLWSDSNARLKLEGFDSFANATLASDNDDGFQTTTIDEYRKAGAFDVGLIQLDIEGAELQALRGASRTMCENKPHIVFEVHRDYVDWSHGLQHTDICRALVANNYSVFAVRDFNSNRDMSDKPIELVPMDKVYLEGPPHGFNMVAVQDVTVFSSSQFRFVEWVSPKLLAHKSAALHHPTDGL